MSEIVRYIAEPQAAVNENGRQTEPLQIAVIWLSNPKSVDGKVADENAFPPVARVSAKTRDENEWDAHDVCEFSR